MSNETDAAALDDKGQGAYTPPAVKPFTNFEILLITDSLERAGLRHDVIRLMKEAVAEENDACQEVLTSLIATSNKEPAAESALITARDIIARRRIRL